MGPLSTLTLKAFSICLAIRYYERTLSSTTSLLPHEEEYLKVKGIEIPLSSSITTPSLPWGTKQLGQAWDPLPLFQREKWNRYSCTPPSHATVQHSSKDFGIVHKTYDRLK